MITKERFDTKYRILDNGCWEWLGALMTGGYGSCWYGKQSIGAHRVSYFFHKGIMSNRAQQIDHLCRNRACVNPDHMELVTRKENILRGMAPSAKYARSTRCIRGHEFDEKNTIVNPDGHRNCRECVKAYGREWKRSKRLASC